MEVGKTVWEGGGQGNKEIHVCCVFCVFVCALVHTSGSHTAEGGM